MIDNVSMVLPTAPPPEAIEAKSRPFELRGNIYSPKYRNGEIKGYEASINNLKVFIGPQNIYLTNSLHKFFKGNNYSDFRYSELHEAICRLSEVTGYNWIHGAIKKIEYGCNIVNENAHPICGLVSYRGKNYLPMSKCGKVYGWSVDTAKYTLKGYDKQYQVGRVDGLKIDRPIFRWEVVVKHSQYLERKLNTSWLPVEKVFQKSGLQLLAKDAVQKFEDSIKIGRMNLKVLTAEHKKILAVMLNPEIRQDFKDSHREAYKKYVRVYRQIMSSASIALPDNMGEKISEKMAELLSS